MENLKKIRITSGKSMSDIANYLGISKQRYFFIENNVDANKKHEELLRKLANYLGVSVFDLLGESNLVIKPTSDEEWAEFKASINL